MSDVGDAIGRFIAGGINAQAAADRLTQATSGADTVEYCPTCQRFHREKEAVPCR